MTVLMTLLVRDEVDIVDAQLAFHLNAGVDFVIATDNGSTDGTLEVLERYQREGWLDLRLERGDIRQAEWVTEMARRAAREYGADWVINADADEFWWPRGGDLKEIVRTVPRRFGCVRGMWRHFAPRPQGPEFFAERMLVRVSDPASHSGSPFSPRFKTMHRGDPHVEVSTGNHNAYGESLVPIHGWYPIDVLHFPIRSIGQCKVKLARWYELAQRGGYRPPRFWALAHEAAVEDRFEQFYAALVLDDDTIEQSSPTSYVVDDRLRDTLRQLEKETPDGVRQFALPPEAHSPSFKHPDLDSAYLCEIGAVDAQAPLERLRQRVEEVERRVEHLDRRRLLRSSSPT